MPIHRLFPIATVVLLCAGLRAADGAATLSGNVSNLGTGSLLEGARVEIPALGVSVLTDATGRYILPALPTGTHEIVVTYTGLDVQRASVTVGGAAATTRDFDLTAAIYQLAAFKITGEREGFASAITATRNADNVKNVVATDQFGNLPNLNAGEVAMRLPGVFGAIDDTGNSFGFVVRGMPTGLNTTTMDGAMMTGQGSLNRTTVINNITSTMFEAAEVTMGHRPDEGADSLGGTINFRSRSPLTLREKRRINYSVAGRLAPSFTQQIPLRREHPFHQILNLGWQEVFDAFGGQRNLGIALNLFSSETALGWFNTTRDYENTPNRPAYLWDYRTTEVYSHRRQNSINLKTDYRLSPNTKLMFLVMAVDHSEVFRRNYDTRAFTNQTAPNATTSGVVPGYTDLITTVRAVPTSIIDVTQTGPNNFFNRLRRFDVGAEQKFGRLELDYAFRRTGTHINIGSGNGGVLTNRISNVGWILDRTNSNLYPTFTQTNVTAANDITNPANYRPNGFLSNNNTSSKQDVDELRFNARIVLPVAVPASFKTGFSWREQAYKDKSQSRRWTYLGTTALPADPSLVMFDTLKTGRRLPQWQATDFISERQIINPALWREDAYFFQQNHFTGTRSITEDVTAVYGMAQVRFGRTGILAGVRRETTETDSSGYIRSRSPSSAAEQTADPVGSAQHDYADNLRVRHGRYADAFPSIHLTRDLTPNLRAKLSWSTSFGRPALSNSIPSETVAPNANPPTITLSNPGLLPQRAENWDANLAYYFEPAGTFSVGFFRKAIKNYIVTAIESGTVASGTDNGFNGDYAGYTILESANGGRAFVQGWEFNYSHQLTFLPGLLRGLAVSSNATLLETHGDFGGTTNRSTKQVAGFVPRNGNVSLSWRYRSFSTRVLANYAGTYLQTYAGTTPWRNIYRAPRTTVTLGLEYRVRPSVSLTCDIDNLTNAQQFQYIGIADQIKTLSIPGTTITMGLRGQF